MKHHMETDGTGSRASKQHRAETRRECIQGGTARPSIEDDFDAGNGFVDTTTLRIGRRTELHRCASNLQRTERRQHLDSKLSVHRFLARDSNGGGAKGPRIASVRWALGHFFLPDRSNLPRVTRFFRDRRWHVFFYHVNMQGFWVGCGARQCVCCYPCASMDRWLGSTQGHPHLLYSWRWWWFWFCGDGREPLH